MAAFLAELLFDLIGYLLVSLLKQAAVAVCAWFDPKIQGRAACFAVGISLGLAAYFLFPVAARPAGF